MPIRRYVPGDEIANAVVEGCDLEDVQGPERDGGRRRWRVPCVLGEAKSHAPQPRGCRANARSDASIPAQDCRDTGGGFGRGAYGRVRDVAQYGKDTMSNVLYFTLECLGVSICGRKNIASLP